MLVRKPLLNEIQGLAPYWPESMRAGVFGGGNGSYVKNDFVASALLFWDERRVSAGR